ncbi:MAG TPA: hypothetical protein PKB09_02205 [Candidatus Saccharibacteria bacterium]|nr:hypothetical protein [Candidatus Saccharibacteria bacterium]
MIDNYDTSPADLDKAWEIRHEEIRLGTAEWRQQVLDDDSYWAPLPGSRETKIEIAWDKARLDAAEVCGAMALEFHRSLIDTYAIATLTAGDLADDHTFVRCSDIATLASMIVVENHNDLLSGLYSDYSSVLVPSYPDRELTQWYVGGMLGSTQPTESGEAK